jgi:hypothetical protein
MGLVEVTWSFKFFAISRMMNYEFPEGSKLVIANDYYNLGRYRLDLGFVIEEVTLKVSLGDSRHSCTEKHMKNPTGCTSEEMRPEEYAAVKVLMREGGRCIFPLDKRYEIENVLVPEIYDATEDGIAAMQFRLESTDDHRIEFDRDMADLYAVYCAKLKPRNNP